MGAQGDQAAPKAPKLKPDDPQSLPKVAQSYPKIPKSGPKRSQNVTRSAPKLSQNTKGSDEFKQTPRHNNFFTLRPHTLKTQKTQEGLECWERTVTFEPAPGDPKQQKTQEDLTNRNKHHFTTHLQPNNAQSLPKVVQRHPKGVKVAQNDPKM